MPYIEYLFMLNRSVCSWNGFWCCAKEYHSWPCIIGHLKFFLMFILFLRESMSGGGQRDTQRERERDIESEVGSRLRAVNTEPNAGLELTSHEIMT